MTSAPLTRRQVLGLLGAFGAALATAQIGESAPSCPAWLADADLEAVRALGRQYQEANAADRGITDIGSILDGDEAPAVTALRDLATADYEAGRLVKIGGWYLSRTEGRLFAALAARC